MKTYNHLLYLITNSCIGTTRQVNTACRSLVFRAWSNKYIVNAFSPLFLLFHGYKNEAFKLIGKIMRHIMMICVFSVGYDPCGLNVSKFEFNEYKFMTVTFSWISAIKRNLRSPTAVVLVCTSLNYSKLPCFRFQMSTTMPPTSPLPYTWLPPAHCLFKIHTPLQTLHDNEWIINNVPTAWLVLGTLTVMSYKY